VGGLVKAGSFETTGENKKMDQSKSLHQRREGLEEGGGGTDFMGGGAGESDPGVCLLKRGK